MKNYREYVESRKDRWASVQNILTDEGDMDLDNMTNEDFTSVIDSLKDLEEEAGTAAEYLIAQLASCST